MSTSTGDLHQQLLARPTHGSHFVLFYDDEDLLTKSVATFLRDGISEREPVIVIATAAHCEQFRAVLQADSIDVADAMAAGRLKLLDAEETLASFMVDGMPDGARFATVLDREIGELRERFPRGRLRAYGEMVDLLCREGQGEAAIRLEELWTELANRHSFSLFCAYIMDSFSGSDPELYARVCEVHTHAFPSPRESRTHARLRAVADLQQRARVLEAEIERAKHSDMFRLLVESVKDYAIFVLDPGGKVQTWNAGAQRIKGYAAHEIVGQHFSRFYPQEDIDAGKCELELEGAARDGRFEDEGWRVRKDGARFWANVIITALFDDSGKLVGFAKVTRDLTERRKAEEERHRAERERAEFAKSQEVNRIKDQFLATLSHELRTPLNAIFGWATLLMQSDNLSEVTKAAETIQRNANAQMRIVDDLLDISRIVTGKMRLDVAPVELQEIVRDALEVVRPAADAKEISLVVVGADRKMIVVGDALRLQQTIWNLLSNSVKFSGRNTVITVTLQQEGSTIELAVSDQGRGIEPAFLPYVFEPFRQADTGATRKTGGVGLGLAIAKHIVELHGGSVSVTSEGLGKGTTFLVKMPIRAVVPQEDKAPRKVPASSGAAREGHRENVHLDGVCVLVVDDDADARDILCLLLRNRGASVVAAGSAEEGRRLLGTSDPHVIVSDIAMPGEDGYQFLRSVRTRTMEEGGMTPALALTAYAYNEDRRRALEAGFNYHLAKPVNHEELLSAVRNLVTFAGKRSAPRP
ncbi:ATP-binding protein [Pendulispora rubella]|uniref:histidine kinase n=1 Tax=Pendulispora rubella TaxID=2741070 RepID=A0ABZ2L7F7_9BACT